MRLHLTTSPSTETIPYNYQPKLVGVLHKWLGPNNLHGAISLYSFSRLMKGNSQGDGFSYPGGAYFFISFYDDDHLKQVLRTILKRPGMFGGLSVVDVAIEENPDLNDRELFRYGSPIFIKRSENSSNVFYTYESDRAGELLKETLLSKMEKAGLPPDETLQIKFDTHFSAGILRCIQFDDQ